MSQLHWIYDGESNRYEVYCGSKLVYEAKELRDVKLFIAQSELGTKYKKERDMLLEALKELLNRVTNDRDAKEWFIDEQVKAKKAIAQAEGE